MARRVYYFRDFECPDGHKTHTFIEAGTEWVKCDSAGCALAATLPADLRGLTAAVHGDALDYIDHNLGKEPVHIRSKSQRRALMAAAGLEEFIRHTPVPGTDKSPHTIPWTTMDAQTLENARVLVSRQGGERHIEAEEAVAPVANAFNFEATPDMIEQLVPVMSPDEQLEYERAKAIREGHQEEWEIEPNDSAATR